MKIDFGYTIMNPLVLFFPKTVEKKNTNDAPNCSMKCLKVICVDEIIDDIIVIINYRWQFYYFDKYNDKFINN